jgi:starch synthase
MKIALISSEAVPFSKTGGLADVAGTLFREYGRMGLDVSLFVPLYKATSAQFAGALYDLGVSIDVPVGSHTKKCEIFSIMEKGGAKKKGGRVYFIANDEYFNRDELYGPAEGDYPDNAVRFTFFCRGVLEACRKLSLKFDIFHCNDWQTGLIPLYLDTMYWRDPLFAQSRTMFTIHNLGYQGIFPPSALTLTGLGPEFFTPQGIEFYGNINLLKAGIISADMVTTVSETYAREILTTENGFGLDGVLMTRRNVLYGVLNGIDYNEWNPSADKTLPELYSRDKLAGKKICKRELMARCSFTGKPEAPVLSFVGRLSGQKGIALLMDAVNDLMRRGLKLFILGKGDARLEKLVMDYASRYPGDMHFVRGFDDRLAHLAYAGSDIFLMPSVYEPCGLGQMIAMRYGTLPVAFNTGGLADSITSDDDCTAASNRRGPSGDKSVNGFLFNEHSTSSFLSGISRALTAYSSRPVWTKLMRNAMDADFSWSKSAARYLELYREASRHA